MKRLFKLTVLLFLIGTIVSSCKIENVDTMSEQEPNNNFSSSNTLNVGKTYEGEIKPNTDIDFFKIVASNTKTITVVGKVNFEPRVKVYDQDEVQFYSEDAGTKGGTLITEVLSSDFEGFFYISIEEAYGIEGEYTIKVE